MANEEKKILIIRLGAIGDVAQTTIIPKAIKDKHPNYEIHYLTQSENVLFLKSPYIDKIYSWDRRNRKSYKYLFETALTIFKERYDIVLILSNTLRNIVLSLFACPKKIVRRKNLNKLWVEEYFYAAKSAIKDIELPDRLYLVPNEESDKKIKEFLNGYPRPYVVFVPGGRTANHRQGRVWNIDYWKELSKLISDSYGGTIFVCGSKGERVNHEKLQRSNVIVTSGDYNLSDTGALLSCADLVVSGDTGPVHMASAYNVKTLSILGSTSPDRIKPYGENGYYISADTDCKYCWKKKCKYLKNGEKYTPCMELITPKMVMDKIIENKLL